MENNNRSKYFLVLAIILIIIGLVYLVYLSKLQNSVLAPTAPVPYQVLTPKSYPSGTTVSLYKTLPPSFPKEITLENKPLIYAGEVKGVDGKLQTTVSYNSDKSIIDVVNLYAGMLSQNGWKVTVPSVSKTTGIVAATKTNENLIITISPAKDNIVTHLKVNTVTFQLTTSNN